MRLMICTTTVALRGTVCLPALRRLQTAKIYAFRHRRKLEMHATKKW
jgi:hypothetical protein